MLKSSCSKKKENYESKELILFKTTKVRKNIFLSVKRDQKDQQRNFSTNSISPCAKTPCSQTHENGSDQLSKACSIHSIQLVCLTVLQVVIIQSAPWQAYSFCCLIVVNQPLYLKKNHNMSVSEWVSVNSCPTDLHTQTHFLLKLLLGDKSPVELTQGYWLHKLTVRLLLLGSLKQNWPIRLQDKNNEFQSKPIEPIPSRRKTTVKTKNFRIIHRSYHTVIWLAIFKWPR